MIHVCGAGNTRGISINVTRAFDKNWGTQKNHRFVVTVWGQSGLLKLVHLSLPSHTRF